MSDKLSREQVERIAHLARLQLSGAEVEKYRDRLGRVLEYIQALNQVSTSNEPYVRHVPRDSVSMREDKTVPFGDVDALMDNAPFQEDGFFQIPSVMD